jgi:hypothetical protein
LNTNSKIEHSNRTQNQILSLSLVGKPADPQSPAVGVESFSTYSNSELQNHTFISPTLPFISLSLTTLISPSKLLHVIYGQNLVFTTGFVDCKHTHTYTNTQLALDSPNNAVQSHYNYLILNIQFRLLSCLHLTYN